MKAFRLDSGVLTSIPRNSYDYGATWTADTPTNVTEALTTGANGPTIRMTSATATNRGGGRYTTGTRISASVRGWSRGVSGAAPPCGPMVYLLRPGTDNRRIVAVPRAGVAGGGYITYYLLLYTDKDTYSALRASANITGNIDAIRLESRAGTVTFSASCDGGANYETLYTATDAAAFGTAGAGTHVGIGSYTESASAVVNNYAPYALVEA